VGFAYGVAEDVAFGCPHVEVVAACLAGQVRERAEVQHAAADVERARLLLGTSGIGHLGGDEFIEAPFDAVGNGMQHPGALGGAGVAPGALHCGACGLHRAIHLAGVGFADVADDAAVDR
jgi:hypothetical protein